MELCRRYNCRCRIRYARYLDAREFKTGDFVLLGSRESNRWAGLFQPRLNFTLDRETTTSTYRIRNRSPLRGEQAYYEAIFDDMGVQESYAYLALLPNLAGTGNVSIISGVAGADTEAAGELITSPGFSATLARILSPK